MRRRTFIKQLGAGAAGGLLTLITPTGLIRAQLPAKGACLEESFLNPPQRSAKPYTWWHWMNGNVSKEGITLDLEAMKRVGLGGFQQFDVGKFTPPGPAVYGSREYWELKKHAIREAARLGLDFEMHNCPGWSSSGGPWITPELSMQVLTWSETHVEGNQLLDLELPRPQVNNDYFRDVVVLAFPSLETQGIPNWLAKANFPNRQNTSRLDSETFRPSNQSSSSSAPAIDPESVLDITPFMDGKGALRWQAPSAGKWTILRIGSTTTGAMNSPAPLGGSGLECDKLSKKALEFHLEKVLENLLPALAPLIAGSSVGLLIDSFEAGMQNWTPEFSEEFRRRRGYDLKPYLPAMTGRVVGSMEESEQFLWDVRRTQSDLMADNYYGHFTELCHRHGIKTFAEPYGSGNFEELQAASRVDAVMGEFWLGGENSRSAKLAATAAHVFGKKIVGAESFSGFPPYSKWQEYPFHMKPTGDWMFTHGINRFIFHRFAHQPHPTARPGMTMGPWGFHFDRTNTWFEKGGGKWLEYLTRCQSLLQQGLFVADILYFGGEDVPLATPVLASELNPAPPEGYQWDVANAEAILNRISIKNGRIVLPDKMTYRLMVIPAKTRMTLAVLARLYDLVKQGLTLVGDPPEGSPSLSDRKSQNEFNRIAAAMWGGLTEGSRRELKLGDGGGRVFRTQSLRGVLDVLGVAPDFTFTSRSGDAPINFIHRRIEETDVYFVANRRRRSEEIVATFRVRGKRPELWNPDTGEMRFLEVYELLENGVRVPLAFDPAGSMFVVFRSEAPLKRVHSIEKDGNTLVSTKPFELPVSGLYRDVMDNFTISVWVKPEVDLQIPKDLENSARRYPSFVIYPPPGERLYGANHVACGLTAGRNGVLLFERSSGIPKAILKIDTPLSGWTHLAVVYKEGIPTVYIDGQLRPAGRAAASAAATPGKRVHPGLGEAFQTDNASYYNGDMCVPELFAEPLGENRIRQLFSAGAPQPDGGGPLAFDHAGSKDAPYLIWQNGLYKLNDQTGHSSTIKIKGIEKPVRISGPWRVSFPPELGAPPEITLPELISLHRHADDGVRYFSGTASYRKRIKISAGSLAEGKRLFLDLGRVEVIAEVKVNHRNQGILWKPPYRIDITDAVTAGDNDLEILVTNLLTNRLIGDEQISAESEYYPGLGYGGSFPAGIKKFPDWYTGGKPKPADGRVAFTVWKHYDKDAPLTEAGLIGPVMLRSAAVQPVNRIASVG